MPTCTSRPHNSLLHDARERAGVRKAIALELVVEIAVRVDVEDA